MVLFLLLQQRDCSLREQNCGHLLRQPEGGFIGSQRDGVGSQLLKPQQSWGYFLKFQLKQWHRRSFKVKHRHLVCQCTIRPFCVTPLELWLLKQELGWQWSRSPIFRRISVPGLLDSSILFEWVLYWLFIVLNKENKHCLFRRAANVSVIPAVVVLWLEFGARCMASSDKQLSGSREEDLALASLFM